MFSKGVLIGTGVMLCVWIVTHLWPLIECERQHQAACTYSVQPRLPQHPEAAR